VGLLSDFATSRGAHSGLRVALVVIAMLGVMPVYHVRRVLQHSPPPP
jgi:hypothetical protein